MSFQWLENPNNPIYNPYPGGSNFEDYWCQVIKSETSFDGNGPASTYKMWHQGNTGISVSYSNDGVNWINPTNTTLLNVYHPCIIYDKDGFGGGLYTYKMWVWDGGNLNSISNILFAQSTDGLNFTVPVSVTQNPLSPLVTGVAGAYFYHLYGPGLVLYNANATSILGQPYTFPYVMFFDSATEGFGPILGVSEEIGLAFSVDGLLWTRYGIQPILIPPGPTMGWNGTHIYRPSVLLVNGIYHMFYSGSNDTIDPLTTIPYAHGIGHATSVDGITWTVDLNPIFIYSDGQPWRNTRTYTPSVLFECVDSSCTQCIWKMWFVGGTGLTTGINQGIGYATSLSPCFPFVPPIVRSILCYNLSGKVEIIECV
jgi:hypothetical protein